MWRKLFLLFAERLIRSGRLDVTLPEGTKVSFGDGAGPHAAITIHDPSVFSRILRNPELAIGETYMEGLLSVENDDLHSLIRLAIANADAGHLPPLYQQFERARLAYRRWIERSPLDTSKSNVEHHYDIPADFYALFMEEGRQYTCAYYKDGSETLEQAQEDKKAHIARKLCLKPGMRVLDIGCGWGGLAVTLARDWGVHVTGITLSQEQLEAARAHAKDAGVSDKVEFRLQDYRHTTDTFDRVVAVGMLEHVGQPQYRTYFSSIADSLAEDGVALIHFIGRVTPPGTTSPFILKYIFPGGYTPALSEVMANVEHSGLVAADIEAWRGHYEKTLRHWRERFEDNLDTVRNMFDEPFIRMWRYYLVAAELGFSDRYSTLYQIQLSKRHDTVPSTRDYLYSET